MLSFKMKGLSFSDNIRSVALIFLRKMILPEVINKLYCLKLALQVFSSQGNRSFNFQ